jgi:pyruvate, orthophosphate dikinase
MIPLTGTVRELEFIQPKLERIAKAVVSEKGAQVDYKFGTMIEIPRACVTSYEIATPGGILQLRHERPDPDDLRLQP